MAKAKLVPTKAIRVKQGGKPLEGWAPDKNGKGSDEAAPTSKTKTSGAE